LRRGLRSEADVEWIVPRLRKRTLFLAESGVEGKLGNGLDGAGEIQTEAEWFNKDRIFSPHDRAYLLGLYNLSRY